RSCWYFMTSDFAISTKEDADYTVYMKWGVTPNNDLLLVDVFRDRIEGHEILPTMRKMYDRNPRPGYIVVESTLFQTLILQEAIRSGLPAKEVRPETDKKTRALPAAARMEAGTIYFREGAPWLPDLEEEVLTFDMAAHDDQV